MNAEATLSQNVMYAVELELGKLFKQLVDSRDIDALDRFDRTASLDLAQLFQTEIVRQLRRTADNVESRGYDFALMASEFVDDLADLLEVAACAAAVGSVPISLPEEP